MAGTLLEGKKVINVFEDKDAGEPIDWCYFDSCWIGTADALEKNYFISGIGETADGGINAPIPAVTNPAGVKNKAQCNFQKDEWKNKVGDFMMKSFHFGLLPCNANIMYAIMNSVAYLEMLIQDRVYYTIPLQATSPGFGVNQDIWNITWGDNTQSHSDTQLDNVYYIIGEQGIKFNILFLTATGAFNALDLAATNLNHVRMYCHLRGKRRRRAQV